MRSNTQQQPNQVEQIQITQGKEKIKEEKKQQEQKKNANDKSDKNDEMTKTTGQEKK